MRDFQSSSKKPSVLVGGIARATIDQVSKAALVDLVSDYIKRCAGREDLTDEEIAAAFVEDMAPVSLARGDAPPKVWTPTAKRAAKPAPVFCQTHRRLRNLCECNEAQS